MRLTFAYNQDGKRVKKTVTDYTNNNAVTTYNYQWDNDMLIAMRMVSATQDITQLYYYDPNGNPVSIRQYLDPNSSTSCANYFYLHAAQNNVIGLCGTSGRVCGEYFYDSWGKETAAPAGEYAVRNLNPIRYKDYLYDSETGLYCTGSRYYNPEWGRFLSLDNVETLNANEVGSIHNDNLFIYCNNNPVTFEDEDGEFLHIIVGGVVSAGFEALTQLAIDGEISNPGKVISTGLVGCATSMIGPAGGAVLNGVYSTVTEYFDRREKEYSVAESVIHAVISGFGAAGASGIFGNLFKKLDVPVVNKNIEKNINSLKYDLKTSMFKGAESKLVGASIFSISVAKETFLPKNSIGNNSTKSRNNNIIKSNSNNTKKGFWSSVKSFFYNLFH